MSPMPLISSFLEHFVLLFALFALPGAFISALVGFFIYRDFQKATDTTSPEDKLAQVLEGHEAVLGSIEENHQAVLEHAQSTREQQIYAARQDALKTLDRLIRDYANAGMPDDLRVACEAALRLDPEHALALSYLGELQALPA
ncbi:MAG: hypothetical protein EA402_06700 [Planctomycetota bacterium]|nr:MAG: hypothetical protein EA402_06700 [Planctomycetota bacterium]